MSSIIQYSDRKLSDVSLKLECYEDELNPAQLASYSKSEIEFNDALKKIESLIKKSNGNIIDKNDSTTIISFPTNISNQLQQSVTISTGGSPIITNTGIMKSKVVPTSVATLSGASGTLKTATTAPIVALPQVAPSGLVTTSSIQQAGTYQLVMDPRLGLLVSTVAQQGSPAAAAKVSVPSSVTSVQTSVLKTPVQTTVGGARRPYTTPPVLPKPTSGPGKVVASYPPSNQPVTTITPAKQKTTPVSQNLQQNKNTSSTPVIDLTDDDTGRGCLSDCREINFNNLSGKTFPSLVVVARPHLKMKDMTQVAINDDRKFFNDRVKSVLMFTPTKFTEWLIQQGLVRSEHYCGAHTNPDNTPSKLKLGMYSDLSKFPYSGGYVWISDCCPQRFVSVFSGSIFEGAPHAPSVLLKLLYHWCSQTSVQNVVQWVKVEKLYVKTFFTNLRAVCTAAISEKFEKLGGPDKKIEVGVISLGTTSADGSMRQVKVEVLGIMDPEKKIIRLRAIEPIIDAEKNVKKRFTKILEPLEQWVHKESTILTDNTVDKSTLVTMGYHSIRQISIHDTTSYRNSNFHVMEYLRRVVPRMFQNTLSLLSRQIIQQFLDELVWRERWGYIPSKAFDSMISHIAEQTKIDSGEPLTARLSKVASNPFRSWLYSVWFPANARAGTNNRAPIAPPPHVNRTPVTPADTTKRAKRKFTSTTRNASPVTISTPPAPIQIQTPKPPLPSSIAATTELTPLESYYYGTIPGDKDLSDNEKKCKLNMKCCSCRSVLPTNIHMMKHLIGHAFNEGAYGTENSKLPQCRYCLTNFVSEFCLQSHLEETHLKVASRLMCLICEEKFNDRTTLILHMHRNHTELELPYHCNMCGFRTSEHRLVVDHFYEKHNEGEKVQCPYCLKTVAFSNNGRKVTQNLYFFLSHIQKHTRKTIARKCNKCALWFVHKGILKEHQSKDHASCKGLPNVERYSNTGLDIIMMPKPLAPGPLMEKHQLQKTKESLINNNFTVNKFDPPIRIEGATNGTNCCECEGDIVSEDHFQGYLACLRCRFSTCCNKSMAEHLILFHDTKNSKEFNIGKMISLDKHMHCVCGFKSTSGNKITKHLALCKRKSAYPSAARAAQCTLQSQSASFPPLVTLDDQEDAEADPSDKWLQAFVNRKEKGKDEQVENEKDKADKPGQSGDPPSMLNILGLVRKQSLDESSLDKTASDSENSHQEPAEVEKSDLKDNQEIVEKSTDMDIVDDTNDIVKIKLTPNNDDSNTTVNENDAIKEAEPNDRIIVADDSMKKAEENDSLKEGENDSMKEGGENDSVIEAEENDSTKEAGENESIKGAEEIESTKEAEENNSVKEAEENDSIKESATPNIDNEVPSKENESEPMEVDSVDSTVEVMDES